MELCGFLQSFSGVTEQVRSKCNCLPLAHFWDRLVVAPVPYVLLCAAQKLSHFNVSREAQSVFDSLFGDVHA